MAIVMWNVSSMMQSTKIRKIEKELLIYNLDFVAI